MVKKVFIKNSDDDLCTLFTTLLPSSTTFGIEAKLESNKTKWATFFVASEPPDIAIEQSAFFIAKISLTPSPVIATTFCLFFNDLTKAAFCSGVTRPNTVYLSANSSISWIEIPSSEIYLSAFSTPQDFAISLAVNGLSPEIILISTPLSLNHFIVSGASFLMWSAKINKATGEMTPFNFSSLIVALEWANIKTL